MEATEEDGNSLIKQRPCGSNFFGARERYALRP